MEPNNSGQPAPIRTGFRELPIDEDFAQRSARYLAAHGYRPGQIQSALVEQLDITTSHAQDLVSLTAA